MDSFVFYTAIHVGNGEFVFEPHGRYNFNPNDYSLDSILERTKRGKYVQLLNFDPRLPVYMGSRVDFAAEYYENCGAPNKPYCGYVIEIENPVKPLSQEEIDAIKVEASYVINPNQPYFTKETVLNLIAAYEEMVVKWEKAEIEIIQMA